MTSTTTNHGTQREPSSPPIPFLDSSKSRSSPMLRDTNTHKGLKHLDQRRQGHEPLSGLFRVKRETILVKRHPQNEHTRDWKPHVWTAADRSTQKQKFRSNYPHRSTSTKSYTDNRVRDVDNRVNNGQFESNTGTVTQNFNINNSSHSYGHYEHHGSGAHYVHVYRISPCVLILLGLFVFFEIGMPRAGLLPAWPLKAIP
ncbi:hypothetical protein DFH27DRAFT_574435 [Peziza echinospora]|nr:hypothetical protein DFH27DRAFT_574435 [Peziza echinospora]